MGLRVILVVVCLFWWLMSSGKPMDSSSSRNQDDSYLSYYRDGKQMHEVDACNGCAHNRAEELRSQGYTVEEHLGRRNSGNL